MSRTRFLEVTLAYVELEIVPPNVCLQSEEILFPVVGPRQRVFRARINSSQSDSSYPSTSVTLSVNGEVTVLREPEPISGSPMTESVACESSSSRLSSDGILMSLLTGGRSDNVVTKSLSYRNDAKFLKDTKDTNESKSTKKNFTK